MILRSCKALLLFVLSINSFYSLSYSQESQSSPLNGRLICLDNIEFPYPLYNDSILESNQWLFVGRLVHPTLIVNNMIISDDSLINCFRNHFDKRMIKKLKWISEEEAEKKGIKNVSSHGALLIRTNRKYYFDIGFCNIHSHPVGDKEVIIIR